MNTTQINFRLPADIKELAHQKAQAMGISLSDLVKHFLHQFVTSDKTIATVQYSFARESILDDGIRSYVSTDHGKKQLDDFASVVKKVVK
jgi:hypothetical protein